jgi:hypothetical protein
MGEWSTRFGWADVARWLLLVAIVLGLLVAAWWPTQHGDNQ